MSGRAAVRGRCAALVVAAALAAVVPRGAWAQAGGAGADGGRGQRASGASLVVEAPCAGTVELREDPFLLRVGGDGQVALAVEPAGSGPGMDVADGVVRVGGSCRGTATQLVLRVSPGMAVRLAGSAEWRVAALGGEVEAALGSGDASFGALRALRLSQHGGGDVRVASVSQRLDATLSGGGGLAVGAASGAATLRVSGAGNVSVASVSLDTLDVTGSGGGDVAVGPGRVGRLSASLSGGGDLHLAAASGSARLVAGGGSDIDVGPVGGALAKVESGGGTVTVHGRTDGAAVPEMPQMPGMPQMPVMPVMVAGAPGGAPGWLAPGLVGLGVLVAAGVALRARAARRRRPDSLRGGWKRGAAPAAGWARTEAVARSRDPEVAVLQQRLAAVEARVAQVERTVTSPEFELHRGFRDLAG